MTLFYMVFEKLVMETDRTKYTGIQLGTVQDKTKGINHVHVNQIQKTSGEPWTNGTVELLCKTFRLIVGPNSFHPNSQNRPSVSTGIYR